MRDKRKRETSATKQKTGFKIMKMAVRHFHVFEVFLGQLEVKTCKILGNKKRLFLQKGGQGRSKVTTFHGRW